MTSPKREPRAGWLVRILTANAALGLLGVVGVAFVRGVLGQMAVFWCVLVLCSTWTLGVYDQEVRR